MVRWATDALDEVRRQAWNDARRLARETEARRAPGRPSADAPARPASARARGLKGVRYVLWKNPENLTDKQRVKLDWIARTDPRLHRGYQLKEGLRLIFQLPIEQAREALDRWVSWARRCRIPAFVKLQKEHRRAYPVDPGRDRAWLVQRPHRIGQHHLDPAHHPHRLRLQIPDALIAMAMLSLGGHPPVLPHRK